MSPDTAPAPGWTRPIRIPAAIPLQHAEPPCARAGELGTWTLPFVLARAVPAGTTIRLQLQGGRNNRGGFAGAQVDNPAAEGYLSASLNDGTPLAMQTVQPHGEFNLTALARELPAGTRLTVMLGDRSRGGPGIRPNEGYVLNKFVMLFVPETGDATGSPTPWAGGRTWNEESGKTIVAACTLHVLGGPAARLRAYAPAGARPGVPFALLVRPEDTFGNRAASAPGALAVTLDGQPLKAERTAVPNSTCIRLVLALPREGVHRLEVAEPATGLRATANPVVCASTAPAVYWGMIHGHTEMSDGTGALTEYFRSLRDDVQLDFAASADHDHVWETPDSFWQTTCRLVEEANRPGAFAALLGYEWAKWRKNGDGDRNVYYRTANRPMYRSDNGHYASPPELFKALRANGEQAIVIPHHTGHGGNFCDWKDHDPAFERLVEIFQLRGSYECAPEDGNPVPEPPGDQPPFAGGYVREALAAGWRVGFTAGGDDHRGDWGSERIAEGAYKQGLMSVAPAALTREAVFDALYQRRVVATTGPRILLDWTLNGLPMGSETPAGALADGGARRVLAVAFHGTAPLDRLDIVRCNRVVRSIPGNGRLDVEAEWTDTEPLASIWMPAARYCPHPFAFYYVRAVQTDNEVAWASPIWIDP